MLAVEKVFAKPTKIIADTHSIAESIKSIRKDFPDCNDLITQIAESWEKKYHFDFSLRNLEELFL